MDKLMLLLLMFTALLINARSDIGDNWLQIDCGATNETLKELDITWWKVDDEFIKTGQNNFVSMKESPPQMNTLRFFPTGNSNCYKLPVEINVMYMIRAGFYYGNYDGLSKPPTFDLKFDGNFWTTVNMSLSDDDETVFHEVYYTPKGNRPVFDNVEYKNYRKDHVQVCLVRRSEDEGVPFISSLEVTPFYLTFDPAVDMNKTALYLHSRNRFGSDDQVGGLDKPSEDVVNRIWRPKSTPFYKDLVPVYYENKTAYGKEFAPPISVISFAIEARSRSSSIYMPVKFTTKAPQKAYFVFYFSEVFTDKREDGDRIVKVYIDGHQKGETNVSHMYGDATVISVYPVTVVGSANVTISAAEKATLPAIINAMEVYTVLEVSNGGQNVVQICLLVLFLLCGFLF